MHHAVPENISACLFQRKFYEQQLCPIVCTLTAMGGSSCIHLEIRSNYRAKALRMHTLIEVFPRTYVSPFLLNNKKKINL